jgi:hypothetical protein
MRIGALPGFGALVALSGERRAMNALNKGELAMTARCSHRSIVVLLLGLGLVATGCATATHSSADGPTAASVAAQPSPLAGTWYGSSYGVGSASKYYGATLTVRFEDDGTWKAVETQGARTRQFSGTSTIRGDEVFLTESTGHYFITLTRRGNRLYGLHGSAPDYTYPGPMALEMTRAESS